ncbi:hypothetical protein N657DRAFT_687428 [Parathielavia appendiculata]|uniref:Uncharacterized protein n=1 Tax=Parathielavia appendiculata TaxID=2587402 RepID=A0AAN6U5Z3_9PEZI|nr:hypothetical protein N657DRAFT_687428 [Parathielavia appendiculata]
MVLLLLDFDGTITQHDTLSSLIALAIAETCSSPPPTESSSSTAARLSELWDDIVKDYVTAHKRHVDSYAGPPAEQRDTLQDELAYLESVRGVELRSVARVGEAGFFRGLGGRNGVLRRLGRRAVELGCRASTTADTADHGKDSGELEGTQPVGGCGPDDEGEKNITVEGEQDGGNGDEEGELKKGAVVVRRGLGEFLEHQASRGWDVAVVSVNWSGEFIQGVVEAGCEPGRGRETVRRMVANGIGFPNGRVEGPKELGGEPLVSAGDKLRAMNSLRRGWEEEKVVYFGDSTTDLACLVEADLGVIIADDGESKLLRTLKRIGFEVSHIGETKGEGKLVWARDFMEVLQSATTLSQSRNTFILSVNTAFSITSSTTMCFHGRLVFSCRHYAWLGVTQPCSVEKAFDRGETDTGCGVRWSHGFDTVRVQQQCAGCTQTRTKTEYRFGVVKERIKVLKGHLKLIKGVVVGGQTKDEKGQGVDHVNEEKDGEKEESAHSAECDSPGEKSSAAASSGSSAAESENTGDTSLEDGCGGFDEIMEEVRVDSKHRPLKLPRIVAEGTARKIQG